ncbi:alpha/beta hydrolase family protein [Granulicella sibirica]|uniref:TolB protein n=1 Tax=Granulicella sibirica TaxID=2479048 RepID=A0A4Q0T409_9BACT|nr:S9 family peptidase [Granulicella sibirica]RXH56768.1 tolB protein precursor [Granulicella sibirica]
MATLLSSGLNAFAQSGVPAPVEPLKTHDPVVVKAMEASEGHVKMPGGVAISPDGKWLAYTVGRASATLHLMELANPDPAKDKIVGPNGDTSCSNADPVWSPDGQWLAYTSSCTGSSDKPGQEQVFLWSKATGASKQLTHLSGLFHQVAWAPDGKTLAFLFVENATRSAGATAAMKPWSGVIGEDGIEVQRVAAVDVATGELKQVTPEKLHVFEFDWAQNSSEMTYIAAPPPGENNWWVADLYTQTLGQDPKAIVDTTKVTGALHGLQMAVPRFSPDGKKIAFIGGLMSDQGSTGGDIWVVEAKGGEPVDVKPGIDGTPAYLAWVDNGKVGFVEDRRGKVRIPDYDVKTKTEVPGSALEMSEVSITGGSIKDAISVSKNGVFAFVKSGLTAPPEVWAGPETAIKQVTHLNDGATLAGGKTESIEWTNEGFHVQGWLTYPANYDPAKKYPMIVSVHGGPSASIGPRWNVMANYSLAGYFVFQPNPRGSFGQGEKFTEANRKDFGYGDLRDILAGMDVVEKKVSVDPKREGLTGWSYGGFMTMFGVTQTTRFRAAVAGAGISDWLSYYGENSIDQWMTPFFGATVYDDTAVYAKSSALTFIKKVKTPTLIIVGDRDGECPAPQSFEFWHALRAEGVKTQLVIYPNEGHHFADPAHEKDRDERMLTWFQKEMPAE